MPADNHGLSLLHFPEHATQANKLARLLDIDCQEIGLHRFPDQESIVTVPETGSSRVAIYLSLDHPNHKLIELMLASATLKETHQQSIILIAPYLCYMRQDIAFKKGDAVSQKIIGKFLADYVDVIITVDPHLHRTAELLQAVPAQQAIALSSARLQAEFIIRHCRDAILVGPDQESEQWVRQIAAYAGVEYIIAHKQRLGDREVRIELPEVDIKNRHIILIDDMASTGQTLATCARLLHQHSVRDIKALVTHALFIEHTEDILRQAGIDEIWSTDSVSHPSNRISLSPLLADALRSFI